MPKTGEKQISDPIHGVIRLSELEVKLVEAASFQRLRNIKQLGLAHYVFPGADYSRFSHSVGACHVMGRIVDALCAHRSDILTREERQLYRVAALLHDIGHYPFSHATEYAFQNYYSGTLFAGSGREPKKYVMHETVTGLVIRCDREISNVLAENGIDPESVENIIRRQVPNLSNLISSDLDADRIDYLLRTAHHAGLPYGSVDIDYLLTQFRVDREKRVCLTRRAVRAADHMLLCRYFDYQQVTFHKVVQGFEWVLKGCIGDLVSTGRLDGTAEAIEDRVRTGTWSRFDDGALVELIRALRQDPGTSEDAKLRADSVLDRKTPVVLHQDERICSLTDLKGDTRKLLRNAYRRAEKACIERLGIPPSRINLWEAPPLTLTKLGGHIAITEVGSEKATDALGQAIRILRDDEDSDPIQALPISLMSVLADHGVRPLRLYALLSGAEQARIDEIRAVVRHEIEG